MTGVAAVAAALSGGVGPGWSDTSETACAMRASRGSARSWRFSRPQPASADVTTNAIMPSLTARAAARARSRQGEDIELVPLRGRARKVLHGVHEAQRGVGITSIQLPGHDRAGPSAHAGQD